MTLTRRRIRLFKAMAVVLGVAVVFGTAEAVGRILPHFTDYRYRFLNEKIFISSPYLEIIPRPGASVKMGPIKCKINKLGFRGPGISIRKTPGTLRIVCLGGSTTFGMYHLVDGSQAYPGHLQRLLDALDFKAEVVNGGVPGYSTLTTIVNIITRIRCLEPGVVVVMHNTNDLARNGSGRLREELAEPALHDPDSTIAPRWLIDHSYAAAEAEYRIQRFFHHWRDSNAGAKGDYSPADGRVFEENLRLIVELSRRFGFKLVLVTMAQAIRPETKFNDLTLDEKKMKLDRLDVYPHLRPEAVGLGLERYNEIIRRVARETGVILADSAPLVPKTPQYFYDRVHLQSPGHAIVAQCVARSLMKAGVIPSLIVRNRISR